MLTGSRTALFATLVLALLASLARAGTDPEVDARKQNLMSILTFEGEAVRRAKAVARLADLDNEGAAQALLECLDKLGTHQARLEEDSANTREQYEEYKGFSFRDEEAWDIKRRLTEKMEALDSSLRGNSIVLQSFAAAISRMKDEDALKTLGRALAKSSVVESRRVLYGGLLRNDWFDSSKAAKAGLSDRDPGVRLAVLSGLGDRKDPELIPLLAKGLQEKGWPHRQAAARALATIGDVRGIPPLIAAMSVETGRLVEVYAEALATLTGEKLGPHPDVWQQWYEAHKKKLAEQGAKPVTAKKPKAQKGPVNYYGIQTRSRRIVFIIDVSGSMKEIIGEKPKGPVTGPDDGEAPPHGPKIEVAKKTLRRAVHALDKDTYFNIIVFNHAVRPFSEEMLQANDENKNNAYLAIEELAPSGATYTYGALKEAFRVAGRGATDKAYDPGVDTIFLLSDGAPTDSSIDKAKPMDGDKILDAVEEWNKLSRIQVHTIAIDPQIGRGPFIRFMKLLAKKNDGTYTEIGN